jgi:oxygen-independent coproporphyrinogen-3 oxidase
MRSGVYLHIPFCAARCHYCNFATGGYESALAERYVAAIETEIRTAPHHKRFDLHREVDTVYLGGGTPTTLSPQQLSGILSACREVYLVADDAEVTIEANPGSVSSEYLSELRSIGINRLSFGVQSFNDHELEMIGRIHNADEARHAVALAREAGFDNVSLDLIAGLPEQSITGWRYNVEQALELEPDHLSVYLLELYKDAPLLHRIERGELHAVDEQISIDSYFILVDEAERRGYEHYEISNWAKPGRESRHNLKYWTGAPYWAFGVSAAGYDRASRWSNTRNIHEYLERVEDGASPVNEHTELTDDDRQSEALFLQLRLKSGVDLQRHEAEFGVDVLRRYASDLDRLNEAGLIEVSDGALRISRAGTVLANEVFAVFV